MRLPIHRRQVNERWLDQYRSWVYGSGFGWQIGNGLSTYITTAAVYLMVVLAALTAAASVALAIGIGFGLVRGLAVLLTRHLTDPASLRSFHRRFADAGPRVGRAVVVVELAGAAAVGAYLRSPSALALAAGPVVVAGLAVLVITPGRRPGHQGRRPRCTRADLRRHAGRPWERRHRRLRRLLLAQSPSEVPGPPVVDETRADSSVCGLPANSGSDPGSGSAPGWDGGSDGSSARSVGSAGSARVDRPRFEYGGRCGGRVATLAATPPPERSDPGDQQDRPGHGQGDARTLDQKRAEVPVLTEPQVLVEETLDAPKDHAHAEDDAGRGEQAAGPVRCRRRPRPATGATERSHRSTRSRITKMERSSMAWKIGTGRRLPTWSA